MKSHLQKWIIVFAFLFGIFEANSQPAVKSFRKLETDQEARIISPKMDQMGKKCAILKVVTSQVGFAFDFGMIGNAVATEQKTGEIWVWVPAGARKVTINHQQLGVLRDYLFDIDIEAATVYEMVLSTGKVITTMVEEQIASQWLVINSAPSGADIYIDDQPANLTPYQNELPLGKHTYRLSRDMYLPTAGSIVLTTDKKETLNLVLKPDFGTLKITTTPESGAAVSIDGQPTNKITPCTLEQVKTGEHTVALRLNMYKTSTEKITMQPDGNINLPVILAPTFAEININTNPAADIYVAGERKGNGTWTGRLLPGIYLFEARKEKHTAASEKREVITGQPLILTLQPIPKSGLLKVMTTPTDATILLDGVNKGTTPATLKNLLVGDYTLTLTLPNYATITKTITIAEGETAQVNETLINGRAVTIISDPAGATLFVDGNRVGITPFSGSLTFGSHTLKIEQGEKKAEKSITVAQTGGEKDFSLNFGSLLVTDVDGNVYFTVTIGTQTWMASNLKTTKYKDGTAIQLVTDDTAWRELITPGYCWYNNADANRDTYGVLYNWYAVNTGKLCPIGWHVPTDAEWTTLITYLGGETVAGEKLKEIGTNHWSSPNTGATNETGFTALPGGCRAGFGPFNDVGNNGGWWSSTECSTTTAWYRGVSYNYYGVGRGDYDKQDGFSVRCLRDF